MATQRLEVYQCALCGNMVEVTHASGGTLSCCNQPMNLLAENSTDAAQEKHVPFIEKVDGGYKVSVGSVLHPMEEDHYIEWIELIADGKSYVQYLNPGESPIAVFNVEASQVTAREYCTMHGFWKAEA